MKLQVNNSGAWKQALTFGIEHIERVKLASTELAEVGALAEFEVGWRILDGTERAVLHYNTKRRWHSPAWMLGQEIVP